MRKSLTVQTEGARTVEHEVAFYNLDVIISAGYQVRCHGETQPHSSAPARTRVRTSDEEKRGRQGIDTSRLGRLSPDGPVRRPTHREL